MFKKGKKTQVVKFDEEESTTQNDSVSQNLMNDISQLKSKENKKGEANKGLKVENKFSFEDDANQEEVIPIKKSLYQQPKETESFETYDIMKETQTTYSKSYLEELRSLTQRSNLNVMEKITNLKEIKDLVGEEEAEEILSESKEKNLADIEAEEGDQEVGDKEQEEIENAKRYREKKRKLNSGEYISIAKENAELEESAVNAEKLRIQHQILDKKKDTKIVEEIDDEEQEELDNWEKNILKKTIDSRTMENIDKFVKKQYNKNGALTKAGEIDNKPANKKVDIEFILKSLDENIKTSEAVYKDSMERVTKFMNLLNISNEEISKQQKTFISGDDKISTVQDLVEFFTNLSECLGEKILDVEKGEEMLEAIEINFGKQIYEKAAFYIADELEKFGSQPTVFSNEEMNQRRRGEKGSRKYESPNLLIFQTLQEKVDFIFSDTCSAFSFGAESKLVADLKSDKTTLYHASKGIFADVSDEYTDVRMILDKYISLMELSQTSEEKIQEWFSETLAVFFRVDLIGFDPLGLSEHDFAYHKNHNFCELHSFKELIPDIDNKILSADKVKSDFRDKLPVISFSHFLNELVLEKMKKIILQLWDPSSNNDTRQLAQTLNLYIQTYYVNNKDKSATHLAKIKEILLKITDKLTLFLELITFPGNSDTSLGYHILNYASQIFRNIFIFKSILPNSTMAQLAIENLFSKKILIALNDFDSESQFRILASFIKAIPQDIIKIVDPKPEFSVVKLKVKSLIELLNSNNSNEIVDEKLSELINFVKSNLTL